MRFFLCPILLSSLALFLGLASAAPIPLLEERAAVSILSTPEVSNILPSPTTKGSNSSEADSRFLRLPHTPPTLILRVHLTAPLRLRYHGIADPHAIN